jgi:hypothetical protein
MYVFTFHFTSKFVFMKTVSLFNVLFLASESSEGRSTSLLYMIPLFRIGKIYYRKINRDRVTMAIKQE